MSLLAGKRILLVEDSPVVAEFAAELLDELECVLVGTAPNMAEARRLASEAMLDAAIRGRANPR